jgi:hypothetical protein
MAIVQISQIKHRRGTGSPPQLASAELGFSVDTQRLYIGNGTLSEGAPVVGVTEIVTEASFASFIADSLSGVYEIIKLTIPSSNYKNLPTSNTDPATLEDTPFVLLPLTEAQPTTYIRYQLRTTGGYSRSGIATISYKEITRSGTNDANLDDYESSINDDYVSDGDPDPADSLLNFNVDVRTFDDGVEYATIRFENRSTEDVEIYYYMNSMFYTPENLLKTPGNESGTGYEAQTL